MEENRFRIDDIVYVPPSESWHFPLHEHDNAAELSLVLDGKGRFYSGNKEWNVGRGTLIVKNPGLAHAEKADPVQPMEQICISIRTEDGTIEPLHLIPSSLSPVLEMEAHFPLLAECFRLLKDCAEQEEFEMVCQRALDLILALVALNVRQAPQSRGQGKRKGEAVIRDVQVYLDTHYREKIMVEELANRFYISAGYLSRQFKRYTGYTVNQYVVSKRMGEAQKLLLFEDSSVKEIASACGYSDLQYFYNVFRRFASCTPLQFREQYGKPK